MMERIYSQLENFKNCFAQNVLKELLAPEQCIPDILEILEREQYSVKIFDNHIPNVSYQIAATEILQGGAVIAEGFAISKNNEFKALSVIEAFERLIMKKTSSLAAFEIQNSETGLIPSIELDNFIKSKISVNILLGPDDVYPINSNGFSVHSNYQSAALNSLLEVVERDVLLRSWFMKNSPMEFGNADINHELISYIAQHGFSFKALIYFGPGNIPVIISFIYNKENKLFYLGSSCKVNKPEAIEKSLKEAFLEFNYKYLIPFENNLPIVNGVDENLIDDIFDLFFIKCKINQKTNDLIDFDTLLSTYRFSLIPIPIKSSKILKNLVAVKMYSDYAVPLFYNSFPALFPKDFKKYLIKTKSLKHPY